MTRRQACWFVAAYVAIVSTAIWFNLAVLCEGDTKFNNGCGGFGIYIPLWLIFLTPLMIAALLLERWRRAEPPPVSRLVGYLVGILLVAEIGFIYIEKFPILLAIEAGAIVIAFLIRLRTARAAGAFALCVIATSAAGAQARSRAPILDMHLHAREAAHYGPTGIPMCAPVDRMPRWDPRLPFGADTTAPPPCDRPFLSPTTDAEVLAGTVASMRRNNVYGVLGGAPEVVRAWMDAAPGRFIPALDLRFTATGVARAATPSGAPVRLLPVDSIRALHQRGAFTVLAEVMNQYAGIAPDDARLEPLWALAEELDVPVGIHIGGGEPAQAYTGTPGFRARLQSALTLEEVLLRHPKLRVYIMHAGYPLLEDLQTLLFSHPQVYVELSMAINVERRPAFYRFLRGLMDAGYGDRVMFGSDQMVWPRLIDAAVRSIDDAPFLTAAQRRDIFYNNAARFLRLSPAEIARHHGR